MRFCTILIVATLTALVPLVFFSGCGNPASSERFVADSVFVLVTDAYSDNTLDSVSLRIIGGPRVVTDNDGIALFTGIESGRYTLVLERNGYESMRSTLTIETSEINYTRTFTYTPDSYVMFRKGVQLKGKIYYKDGSQAKPADSIVAGVALSSYFIRPSRETQTSASGDYAFDSLPEQNAYTLYIKSFSRGGKIYAAPQNGIQVSRRRIGDDPFVPAIILDAQRSAELLVLATNLAQLKSEDRAMVVFSEPLDTSAIVFGSITLKSGNEVLLCDPAWSVNCETLFVAIHGGGWSMGTYTLSLSLKSISGAVYAGSFPFSIYSDVLVIGKVEEVRLASNQRIDYNTAQITLAWSPLEGALAYDIYTKRKYRESSWVLVVGNVSDTFALVNTAKAFEEGQTAQYIVLGRNNHGASNPDSAAIIGLKDNVGPFISPERSSIVKSPAYKIFDNSAGATSDTIFLFVSLIDSMGRTIEPLDTALDPKLVMRNAASDTGAGAFILPDSLLSWRWASRTSGIVQSVVPAGRNASDDSLYVDFTAVTDMAGNAPSREKNGGVLRYIVR
jgi:hypothetical protein